MENASKALLIAGAVLIAIVLISLGVVLVTRSGNASGQAANTSNWMTQQGDAVVNGLEGVTLPHIETTTTEPTEP